MKTFAKLYGPFLVCFVFAVAAILLREAESTILDVKIPVGIWGVQVSVPIQITGRFLIVSSLASLAIASLSSYLWKDYSGFFPERLRMEVFFDEPPSIGV